MLNNEMKNLMYRFLKEHAKTVLPHAKAIQKVLNKLPKSFDTTKIFLTSNSVENTVDDVGLVKFNDIVLVHGDKKFTIQSPNSTNINGVTKALAQSTGFDLRDLNVTKLDEKMHKAIGDFNVCHATGAGSTIEIQNKEIIIKSKMYLLGENIEMVIIFDENDLKMFSKMISQ